MEKPYTPADIKKLVNKLPKFRGCEVEYIDDGVSTEVYKLTCNGDLYYFRLSDREENMSTEALAHKLVLERGVKAPRVLYFEDFNREINRSFMITDKIKGRPTKKEGDISESVIIEAGGQLALINSIKVEGFGWLNRKDAGVTKIKGEHSKYEDFASDFKRIENLLSDLVKNEVIDKHMSKNYLLYVKERKNLLKVDQAVLSHGDFDDSHIYVYRNKYSGIIDFGDVRATSMYHDLAHYYTYAPEHFDLLLEGYKEIKPLNKNYMEKIEFVAMLFVIGKLWWVTKNKPETFNKKRSDYELLMKVLKYSNN